MLAILTDFLPANARQNNQQTPFGVVEWVRFEVAGRPILFLARQARGDDGRPQPVDPRAVALAAKLLGAGRALGLLTDAEVNRPVFSNDYLDFTHGRPTTFFETMGAGYIQQEPPYCPELQAALAASGAQMLSSLLVVNEWPRPAVEQWWRGQGIALISTASQPEGALCRELELCYAALAVPDIGALTPLLPEVVSALPKNKACGCDQLLLATRQSGKLAEQWWRNARP